MTRLHSLAMAVMYFAIGAFFAAISIWALVVSVMSGMRFILLSTFPILFGAIFAFCFFAVGRACLMTAQADRKSKSGPEEVFK